MAKTLGIMVNTAKHFSYLYQLTKAACKKNIETQIFFTGPGVLLTQKDEFRQLVGMAKLLVCEVSFRANNLKGNVPGVGFKEFVTQATNAEMVAKCDRYVVL